MDEGRDRRRARHRVGEPDVERDLRALAGAPEEEEHTGDRSEARRDAGDPNGKVGPELPAHGGSIDVRELE